MLPHMGSFGKPKSDLTLAAKASLYQLIKLSKYFNKLQCSVYLSLYCFSQIATEDKTSIFIFSVFSQT